MRHSRFARWGTGIGALALFAAQATAGVLFTYNGFSSTAGLTLVGDAATASTTDGIVLRVTPASGGQTGAAYSTTAVPLGTNDTFSTQFQFRFTSPGGVDPADGITFVLAANATGLGSSGNGIGYAGVPNSLAIELDTYNNGNPGSLGFFPAEPNSSNHVAIDTDGSLTDTAAVNVYGNGSCGFPTGSPAQNSNTAAGCMSNGDLWTANISYNGSQLSVSLKDSAESGTFVALNNFPIDIAADLGTNMAFVGFTSGTGAGWENHDIVNWQFANTAQISGGPSVPEPSSLLLFGTGLLGLAWRAARRAAGARR